MKAKKIDKRINRSLFSIRSYIMFFLLVSAIVSCCFILFLETLQNQLGTKFTKEQITFAAKITFGNVAFLSLICTVFDGIRRKITMQRPVNRILAATHQLTKGDFSARITPFHSFDSMNEFDVIIEDFNIMAKELSGIETLRTDFIANVSHELKTPLSIMQNYATMLAVPDLPQTQRQEYAAAITDATRRLSALVTNILNLNKLENQQIFPDTAPYELNEQICECILNFEQLWESKNIQIKAELDEVIINADRQLLMPVWNNLISNAIKFTENGGSVTISLTSTAQTAIVTVKDTGCGMSPLVGSHIFEKFYQGDTSHTKQGNGLGLALVKRVIDIIGGNISVQSQENQGSSFTVTLPRGLL